jgi:hypothetical protein
MHYASLCQFYFERNSIYDVIVSVLASGAVYRGFESRWGLPKDYKIGICCFSFKHA